MNKEKKNKIKNLHIRLTEEEFMLFETKSKNYPSMTKLIVDAVYKFDERGGVNIINIINELAGEWKKKDIELTRIGTNINQIAHYLNILKMQDIYTDSTNSEIDKLLQEYKILLNEYFSVEKKLYHQIIKRK